MAKSKRSWHTIFLVLASAIRDFIIMAISMPIGTPKGADPSDKRQDKFL